MNTLTLHARFNLQRGVPENPLNPATRYFSDSAFDNYILSRAKAKVIIEERELDKLEDKIALDITNKIDKIISGFTK